jgi:uncharacterized membrane protein YphA (DoxX/SURF4 family)
LTWGAFQNVREGLVKALPPFSGKKLTIGIRIGLGAIFLFSSMAKIADPSAFAAILTNYQLIDPPLVTLTAVILPWIEALCGVALVFGRYEKGAALLVSLMMIVFIIIGLINAYRGLDIACGCFSLSAKEPSSITLNTLRDLVILAAGIWVMVVQGKRRRAVA